jgi:hypothetical protein
MGQSFGKMRKLLEQEYLCDSLKGRITYFATTYPKLSDVHRRIAVRLDGKEILKADFIDWRRACSTEADDIAILNAKGFDSTEFYQAFYIYQNQSIQLSLYSENPLVRMLAIFDRRVGKRSLLKVLLDINKQPDWLIPLYEIRLEAEGIIINNTQAI